mmetsp:Transcript_162706/g.312425  ORF Transcript_162706/g.312425 Transcript_162706/m.312425 type:complete len:84 (+) Transcript_162706:1-252(+)
MSQLLYTQWPASAYVSLHLSAVMVRQICTPMLLNSNSKGVALVATWHAVLAPVARKCCSQLFLRLGGNPVPDFIQKTHLPEGE